MYKIKAIYKTNSITPMLFRETNLIRPLTARLKVSYYSITVGKCDPRNICTDMTMLFGFAVRLIQSHLLATPFARILAYISTCLLCHHIQSINQPMNKNTRTVYMQKQLIHSVIGKRV